MSYTYNAKEIMESIDLSDVISILASLGADHRILNDGAADIAFNAICHSKITSDEFKPHTFNLVYYNSSKKFICYSGCGRKSYNIFTIVQKIYETQYGEELSFYDSLVYVANICNISKQEVNFDDGIVVETTGLDYSEIELTQGWGRTFAFTSLGKQLKQEQRLQELMQQQQEESKEFMETGIIPELPELNSNGLYVHYEDFAKVPAYNHLWTKDGISLKIIQEYEIRFDNRNKEIIIPHYDSNHRLVGVRSRLLDPDYIVQQGKYRPTYCQGIPLSHPISNILYGLDKNQEEIKYTKKAILFEGEKSVLQLASQLSDSKYNIGVAVCGSSISNIQLKLLKDLGVEEVIIAFDKEFIQPESGTLLQVQNLQYIKKYDEYLEKRRRLLNKVGKFFNVKFIADSNENPLLNYKDSPMDQGLDVLLHLIKNAVLYRKEDFK